MVYPMLISVHLLYFFLLVMTLEMDGPDETCLGCVQGTHDLCCNEWNVMHCLDN